MARIGHESTRGLIMDQGLATRLARQLTSEPTKGPPNWAKA